MRRITLQAHYALRRPSLEGICDPVKEHHVIQLVKKVINLPVPVHDLHFDVVRVRAVEPRLTVREVQRRGDIRLRVQ